ncbi:hypothetical protein D9758_007026 [Tetrapyrgos nigripes]|uniref:FAD-binding PCMH-type domain-containing protein n=1 Tax=Tetrapyrgos nigripes TaxID=182062 RepID=A0A8H5LMS8_9AGAR|nr:hypothetical protein D9758_007026 [Tetrapyrgos nigripes]
MRRLSTLSSLSIATGVLSLTSTVSSQSSCKCQPGDACFPTTEEWSALSSKLSTPSTLLVDQRPMGAVCYPSDPLYDSDACSALNASVSGFNHVFLATRTNALTFLNFDSVIDQNGTLEGCPYFPTTSDALQAVCQQGRVPPFAINVTSPQDIAEGLKFASEHNLRVVVKNTGHDAIGRGFGVGALEIYTQNLKNLTIHDAFVPTGAPEGTEPVHAMTMGAGVSWTEAYTAADNANRTVVGGLSPVGTVGAAGGWQLGTGQSVISPFYGLGADNNLEFTVVLPNGTTTTVNEYLTPDLFWAIRGGGGPSFGIVVDVTVKSHVGIPYTGAFFEGQAADDDAWLSLLTTWMKYHNNISDAGWGGVWPFFSKTLYLTFAAQGDPFLRPEAGEVMSAFFEEAKTLSNVNVSLAEFHSYRSFGEFVVENLVEPTNAIGYNYTTTVPGNVQSVTSSWLIPRDLTAPENAESFAQVLANTTSSAVPFFVGGGAVNDESKAALSAANPAWRRTISDITLVGGGSATTNTGAIRQQLHNAIAPFRALAPPPYGGMYLNEADVLEDEWQAAFWGAVDGETEGRYERLTRIKGEIDPNALLVVPKGVGSEHWDSEIICRVD